MSNNINTTTDRQFLLFLTCIHKEYIQTANIFCVFNFIVAVESTNEI